jgi:hypothetical protein
MEAGFMTLDELKNRLAAEKHILGSLRIECGRRTWAPELFGIYEEDGTWYIYKTDDRGEIIVLAKGNKSDMADALYRRILKAEKRYLKNHL